MTRIGDGAFSNCKAITKIDLPKSVSSIGISSFSGCTALALCTIPNTLQTMGASAFSECTTLNIFSFPEAMTKIPYGVLQGCTNLRVLIIHKYITDIGMWAFKNCTSLTDITCYATTPPKAVRAFDGVSSTIPIYVPASHIGDYKGADDWKNFYNYQPIDDTDLPDQLPDSPVHRFTKVIRDGQMVIVKDGKNYTISGTHIE